MQYHLSEQLLDRALLSINVILCRLSCLQKYNKKLSWCIETARCLVTMGVLIGSYTRPIHGGFISNDLE